MSFLEPSDLPDQAATEEFLRQLARDMATKRAKAMKGDERDDALQQALEYVENYEFPDVPQDHIRLYRIEYHPDFLEYFGKQNKINEPAPLPEVKMGDKIIVTFKKETDAEKAERLARSPYVRGCWYLLNPAIELQKDPNIDECLGLRFYACEDGQLGRFYNGRVVVIDVPETDFYIRSHEISTKSQLTTEDYFINGVSRVDQVADLYFPGKMGRKIGQISLDHLREYIDLSQGKYPQKELFPKLAKMFSFFDMDRSQNIIEIKAHRGPEYI